MVTKVNVILKDVKDWLELIDEQTLPPNYGGPLISI
jgi:hypothetical protein